MYLSAVTNARSLRICSFHHPYRAENIAHTYISLTGVYNCTHGNRRANARA